MEKKYRESDVILTALQLLGTRRLKVSDPLVAEHGQV